MLEQVSTAIGFYAHYVESKTSKTGLTVTVDVWRVNTAGSATEVVTGGSATEIGDGLYYYQLASGSVTVEGEYVAVFKTATTSVDQQHIPAIWVIQKAGVENLDATVATRATPAQVNAEVLDVLNVDTFAEVGQEAPAATQTLRKMLAYLYKAWRNKKTQTTSQYNLYGDDGTTVDQKATVSDDGTTTTVGEVATGP